MRHQILVRDGAMQGIDDDAVPIVRESDPEKMVIGREPQASVGIRPQSGGGMRTAPGLGYAGDLLDQGQGLQVQDAQAVGVGDPEPSEPVFAALADDVSDGFRVILSRESDEGIPVVADQSSSEGADPGEPLAVEIDTIDILVRQTVLPGQPFDDQIVLCTGLGV